MILAFADETSDARYKDYFGLSVALIDASFYPNIKREAQSILMNSGWDSKIEFKGSYLFSASRGCTVVPVEGRIQLASDLLELNVAKKNRRMKFYYVKMTSQDQTADYLKWLPIIIKKALPIARSGPGKDLIALTCDQRPDIEPTAVHECVNPVIEERGYVLHEHVSMATSCFHTVGLLYADIVGYLVSRIDNIAKDAELFENIPPECFQTNGRVKKLKSSTALISKIKQLSLYEVK